jgi:hypothetical protein
MGDPGCFLALVEFGGPGEWQTDPAFTGGGFGLKGAAKGMVTAEVLNALTTQKGVTTAIHLEAAREMSTWSEHTRYPPERLQKDVSWLVSTVQAEAQEERTPPAESIPDQIAKLANLKDQGILTEDEFQAKKTSSYPACRRTPSRF